ncbi:MAG: DNA polymerase III subunit gamma/tau [Endomicrobiia bacterium]|nr:DNA polymerase III subunit gamma/tau [Endomicrobiia bacterium]
MKYEAIARKYRPMNFNEVVGQEHIVSTIANSIASGRIHHAYLFSGTRGVGKTTMARILAKALNCQNGPTAEICGVCDACKGIASGSYVDVQEIDGASNRGIDEIRSLRENVRFAPVAGRYKIFIIDEAHQITGAAFNALLKTLEEPPPHAVFILATTESQSIPATIASRCQKYRFKMISEEEIASALAKILKSEKISFESDALGMIARAADGSMRDAQSLLDQAIAYGDRNVTAASVRELLGVLPSEIIDDVLRAVAASDAKAALDCVAALSSEGHDFSAFLTEMLSSLRSMLLLSVGASDASTGGETALEKLSAKHAASFTREKILRFSKLLLKAKEEMRWTHDARFLTELYLVKMTQPSVGASEILAALDGHNSAVAASATSVAAKAVAPPPAPKATAASPSATPSGASIANLSDIWRRLRESLPPSEDRLRACLANVSLTDIAGGAASFSAASEFYSSAFLKKKDIIAAALEKITGSKYTVDIKVAPSGAFAVAPDEDPADSDEVLPPSDAGEDDSGGSIFAEPVPSKPAPAALSQKTIIAPERAADGIKKILDIFPGKVAKAGSDNRGYE